MKKNFLYFIGGFILASLLLVAYYKYNSNKFLEDTPYFILNKDYEIEKNGVLKKGTKVKFDKGMDEGFSRFILYLNIKGGDIKKDTTEQSNIIIPYWLNEADTMSTKNEVPPLEFLR